jgi:putative nucleotidyltransferase with HDIG domain
VTRARRRHLPARRELRPTAYLPWVLLATFAVAVLPVMVVSAIQTTGALRSTLASVAAAAALSVGASVAGAALWTRRRESSDIVFADLMIWGWIRRRRTEWRLSDARALLGDRAMLSPSQQADLLERLSAALEARDPYTHGHSRRVTRHSEAIAHTMGLSRADVAKVRTAAAVHDVGKLKTPRDVLNKPGRLTDQEFAAIKRHPVDGADLVAGMSDPEITAMVRHHHERLDGRGYPDGLRAAEIPLGARIIAVADTFDAITSTRPYRAGGRHRKAFEILRKEAGTQLDPDAVAAFLRYYSGRRSVAWWSLVVTEPPRFASWLLGWVQGAGATPIAKGVIAATATALAGTAVASPPPLEAGIRANSAAAHHPTDSRGSAPTAPTLRQSEARSPRSAGRTGRRAHRPSRHRSHLSGGRPKRSRVDGSPRPENVATRVGPRDSGSAGSGPGGGPSGSGGGGSGGSSGSGGSDSDGRSRPGSEPGPLPSVEPPKPPPLPAEVPVPQIDPPELPPIPDGSSAPQVEPPAVTSPPVKVPTLPGG